MRNHAAQLLDYCQLSRQELHSTDDRQESCSSAGNCQADEQTLITQLSRPGSRDWACTVHVADHTLIHGCSGLDPAGSTWTAFASAAASWPSGLLRACWAIGTCWATCFLGLKIQGLVPLARREFPEVHFLSLVNDGEYRQWICQQLES